MYRPVAVQLASVTALATVAIISTTGIVACAIGGHAAPESLIMLASMTVGVIGGALSPMVMRAMNGTNGSSKRGNEEGHGTTGPRDAMPVGKGSSDPQSPTSGMR